MTISRTRYFFSLKKHFGLVLFFVMCFIALFSFDEYGVSYDEEAQRYTGLVSYNYIFSGNQFLHEWPDRDYGIAFELPLILIEKLFNLTDTRDIYLSRHLVTHLFFLIGAFFCFKLVDLLYKNKLLATIGFLLIVLHPRIYAHSFFNSKDIPFMSMFVICLYFNAIAFRKKTVINFIILGISIGLLINLRIMGGLLPCFILLFLIIDAVKEKKYNYHLKLGIIFLATTTIVLYATWPFLWTNPIKNFFLSFANMSKFRWDGEMLFNGEMIKAVNIGWDYIPVWFSITTPIFYLFTGLLSTVLLLYHFFKTPSIFLLNYKERNNLIFLICCFFPVLFVILLHSILYDGWRHMYFIYPSFVLLAVYGLDFLFKKNKRWLVGASSLLTFTIISVFMIKNFPVQHVYFNHFMAFNPPEHIRKTFELDYWGTSYKQTLDYILKNDNSPSIDVNVANSAGKININILPAHERIRINFVPIEQATYFITNFRWHPQDYKDIEEFEYYSIKVANNTINRIYKLK